MKVLVTGGTGYLGRAVVSALAARGHDLVVFARSATRSGLPGATIDGDIRDRAALERAATGCDATGMHCGKDGSPLPSICGCGAGKQLRIVPPLTMVAKV